MFRRPALTEIDKKFLKKSIFSRDKLPIVSFEKMIALFKRTRLYKLTVFIRILFIVFLVTSVLIDNYLGSTRVETVLKKNREVHQSSSKYGPTRKYYVYVIKTNFETYSIHQDAQGGSIQLDDSLIIERNVFGKPIYYSKIGSKFKFSLPIDDRYYLLLFLTFLSFLLLKFRFQYNIVCLILISCFNIFAFTTYFVN